MAASGAAQRLAEVLQLSLAPYEAGQPTRRRRLQPRPQGPGPHQFVDLEGHLEALNGHRPQRLYAHVSFRQLEGVGR